MLNEMSGLQKKINQLQLSQIPSHTKRPLNSSDVSRGQYHKLLLKFENLIE